MPRLDSDHPPPAASVRGRAGAVGRSTSAAAEAVSDDLRRGHHRFLTHRRRVATAALTGIGALAAVSAYQTGLVRHLPDPPVGPFDSDAVDASGEAYRLGLTADGPVGIASYALTLVLAAAGGADRSSTHPWLPLALAGKAASDAAWGVYLTAEQASRHRRFCAYCLVASGASIVMALAAIPEARAALRTIRG